ncbi:hypothetical protein V8C43DRAFT_320587 [Trichoderma afarasin]
MVYGYSSSLFQSDSFQNLEDLGTAFHRHLRKLAIAGSFKPIVFIAHSLGGLVLKQTLISLYKSKDKEDQKLLRAVYGIAFFGVPHDGMDISSLIPMVENGPNRFLLESIGLFSSQILSVQHREFLETLGAQESKIICFYETRMSPTAVKQDERGNWKIAGPAAVLVSKSSATHCREWENGPQFICAIDRTHSEMVKFRSEDDEYEKVVELIQSLAREARQTRQCRGQIQKCLQSLAFESMQTRASDINDAVLDTCKWLLQHEAYMNWIASDHGLLWIKGKPGSGKSTLLKYAFRHQKGLSNITSNTTNSDLFLCFFFHGRGVELQKTPFGLFRSLLHQILKQAPDALLDLVDDFTQKCQDIGTYQEKWKWHSNDLWRFLELSLPRLLIVRSIWLFVDALDECGEVHAKDLVRKFKLLIEMIPPLSTSGKQLRICCSCRHYPILSSPALLEVCLEKENRRDISTYVRSELSSCVELIPIGIPYSIIDRSSGVFLWAELVVKLVVDLGLNGEGPTKIMAAVRSIPESLDELYYGLIENMTAASLKLIKWICFARQPLSVDELRWALAINADYSSLNACQNAEDYIPDDNRMKKQIVKLSRGLAEFTTGHRPIVQFIHQSVKDFFLDKGFISLNAVIGTSHLELFKICIQYFAMEEVVRLASDKEKKVPRGNFPFLRYATFSMVEHLKKSDGFDTASEGVLELFEQSSDPLNTWTEIHYEIDSSIQVYSADSPVRDSGLAHLAAKHNIQGIMNVVVQSDSITTFGVDSKDSYGMTPLAWAARYGHEDMCKLLLATGQAEIDWKDIFGRSALSSAAEKGHEAVVKRLLDTGQVEINGKDIFSRSALLFAAENGHEAVVKLLLATGQTEINWEDINGWTALLSAAKNGHETVVKLLLATGQAEIDWKDLFGRSALSLATENGHEAVVKLLLDTGQAEIDWKDLFGQSALSLATDRGYEAIVKLLLTTGQEI